MQRAVQAAWKFLIYVIGTCALPVFAQPPVAPEYALKTAYLLHFIEFTRWPTHAFDDTGALTICVDGDNPWQHSLTALEQRSAHNRPIRIVAPTDVDWQRCHVAILRGNERRSRPADRPILLISDDPARGADTAMISLALEGNRLVFSINNSNARAAGLEISSKLLRLAKTVQ